MFDPVEEFSGVLATCCLQKQFRGQFCSQKCDWKVMQLKDVFWFFWIIEMTYYVAFAFQLTFSYLIHNLASIFYQLFVYQTRWHWRTQFSDIICSTFFSLISSKNRIWRQTVSLFPFPFIQPTRVIDASDGEKGREGGVIEFDWDDNPLLTIYT